MYENYTWVGPVIGVAVPEVSSRQWYTTTSAMSQASSWSNNSRRLSRCSICNAI